MSKPSSNKKLHGTVGIGPLVLFDFLFGGLGLWGSFLMLSAVTSAPPQLKTFFLITGGIALVMSIGLALMGALLFTRQLWAYQVSFYGHTLLFLLQVANVVMTLMQEPGQFGEKPGLGIPIFSLILVGLCAHHGYKLVRQENEFRDIRSAGSSIPRKTADAREPELEAKPGWDETGPKR